MRAYDMTLVCSLEQRADTFIVNYARSLCAQSIPNLPSVLSKLEGFIFL